MKEIDQNQKVELKGGNGGASTEVKYNPEEGTFYEREFSPVSVQLIKDLENEKPRISDIDVVLFDVEGNTAELLEEHSKWSFRKYVSSVSDSYSQGELSNLIKTDQDQAEQVITEILHSKTPTWKLYYDDEGRVHAIVSQKHKQFRRSTIFGIVEKAVQEVYGRIESEQGWGNSKLYQMPVENKYIQFYTKVDPGNNLIYGRSGIRVSTAMRTTFDRSSGGVRAPCMNWANLWQEPLRLFKIETVKLRNLVKTEVEGELPADGLFSFDIHLDSTEITPDQFIEKLRNIKKLSEEIIVKQYIDKSIQEPFTLEEAQAVLDAYSGKTGYRGKINLPAYAINAILQKFHEDQDFTLWGFSQAVSYIRTHGDLRGVEDKGRNRLSLTRILENIAGEMLSLAPTIQKLHEEQGTITFEMLTGKKRALDDQNEPKRIAVLHTTQ